MFCYGEKLFNGHAIRLRYDPDTDNDLCPGLEKRLAAFTELCFRSGHAAYPRNYELLEQDNEDLLSFSLADWAIVAYEVDEKGTPLFVLLAHLGGFIPSYVVNLVNGEIAVALFEEYRVLAQGKHYWLRELRALFDDPDYVPRVSPRQRVKPDYDEEEEEANVPEVQGYFQSNAKKKIRNLGYSPRNVEEEDEEEAAGQPVIPSFTPSFTPGSSKKPKRITGSFKPKPAPVNIEQFKKPAFEAGRKGPIPNLEANPNYRKRPSNRTYVKITPTYDFRPGAAVSRNTYYQLVGTPANYSIKSRIEKELSNGKPEFDDHCIYCPRAIAPGDPVFDLLADFHPEDYAILAAVGNQAKVASQVLLRHISEPMFYLVLQLGRKNSLPILAYSSIDVSIDNHFVSGNFLYSIYEKENAVEEMAQEAEPVVVSDPIAEEPIAPAAAEPVLDEEMAEEEEREVDFDLVEERRLFRCFRFQTSLAKLIDKHPEAEEEIANLEKELITLSEPAFRQFLESRNHKQIKKIHKFRLKGIDYAAARVFFIFGSDAARYPCLANRNFFPSDVLLLDIIPHEQHDQQGEWAAFWEARLKENRSLQLERVFLDVNKKKTDSIAYPSEKQFSLLRNASLLPPVAFIGSAGTGKTILSLQNCLDLQGNGSVLYLTYEPALRDYAEKKLSEMGANNVECYTYAELASSELGGAKLADEAYFHSFLLDYLDKRPPLSKKLKAIGGTRAAQASRVYLYLRGLMFGSKECAQSSKLRQEQFLSKMADEPSISSELASVIYEVGSAYDKHLKKAGLTTDNLLAYRLINKKKRSHSFNAVVLDEYQDLTELQFISLLPYLGSKETRRLSLYLYGDENQCVNPTIFSLSRANAALTEYFDYPFKISTLSLDGSYRSGPNLLAFINKLKTIKKESIGAQKQELDAEEKSLREDQEDLFVAYIEEKGKFADIVKVAAASDADIVFLFPSPSSCKAKKVSLKSIEDSTVQSYIQSSFLSVGEAKGREWDAVVLVDFLSEFGEEFAACLEGKDSSTHASTIHRMMFNRLYVGLTRARNQILLYEEDVPEISKEKLLASLEPLPFEDYRSLFSDIVDPKHWIAHGKRLLAERDYLGAKRAFERVKEEEEGGRLLKIAEKYVYFEDCLNRRDPSAWQSDYINFLLSQNDLAHLHDLYRRLGQPEKADLLHLTHTSQEEGDVVGLFRKVVEQSTFLEKAAFFDFSCRKLGKKIRNALKGDKNNGKRR